MENVKLFKDIVISRILYCTFCILLVLIMFFHEPWFDEAQAWMIARDASLYEILFIVPHYEGHPALWSLLLAIPAKLGIPFEIGLKTIGFIITIFSIYLIIFKSSFPKTIKYSLPFSFFFFYQGGIVVRPYCLLILILLFLGLLFKHRFKKPFLYSFLLLLLCFTSAYGMIFACGIALCLVGELIIEKGWQKFFKEIFKDNRTISLVLLLLGAILIALEIIPFKDTYVPQAYTNNSFIARILCTLFTVVGDCFLTRSLWFYYDRTLLQYAEFPWYSLLSCVLIGIIIWICIYCVSGKKSFIYYAVPYMLFSVFAAIVNFNGHHLICPFALFLFWIWIAMDDPDKFYGWHRLSAKLFSEEKDKKLLERFLYCFTVLCLGMSIYWTISSCVLDIQKEYSYGRSASEFIKENKLDQTKIVAYWEGKSLKSGGRVDFTNHVATAVPINAYFDHNITINLNDGDPHKGFVFFRISTDEENEKNFALIRENGLPDVLLGGVNLDAVFGEDVDTDCYTIVYYMPLNYIWKGDMYRAYMSLSVRNDLLEEYDLSEAALPDDVLTLNLELTEEQIRLYNEGKITLEDIIGSK